MKQTLDVYSLEKAQLHIKAQSDFISRVIDASPDIIHITNIHSGTTVYINRILLHELGYANEDIRINQLEKNFDSLCHTDDTEGLEKFKASICLANDDEVIDVEMRLKANNGSWQWIRTRAKVFQRGEDGGVEKYIGFSQNITVTKTLEEQRKQNALLLDLNRMKTEFFSNASHEFRTPLSLVLGPLQELLADVKNELSPLQLQKLQMAHRSALRLQKLVNTQLDFAKVEAGRMEAVYQPTNIAKFTEDIASSFRSVIESAGLKFIVKCEDADEPLYVSRDMWEKIVLNLLSNAFKFTFEGKIEVFLRRKKKHIQLHVRDTGVGIADQDLPRIFDRFTRIENSKSRTCEGTGIGLALVKELVALHGGTIKVTSHPGRGSLFVIAIPRGKSHLSQKQIYEFRDTPEADMYAAPFVGEAMGWLAAGEANPGQKKARWMKERQLRPVQRTILIADDNSDMRAYLANLLGNHYHIVTAENGTAAFNKIIEGLKPDLILCDIMMPGPDGIQMLRSLKQNPASINIPIILLTARSTEESKIEALKNGAADYIVKPFAAKDLLLRVDTHIQILHAAAKRI
jgi:PAS domain S-box-containing protein